MNWHGYSIFISKPHKKFESSKKKTPQNNFTWTLIQEFTSRIFLKSALISLESDTPSSSQLNINILSYDINCRFVKV